MELDTSDWSITARFDKVQNNSIHKTPSDQRSSRESRQMESAAEVPELDSIMQSMV